ncbi:NAD(P)/FAD-dependent oxidoreductase [Falsiroseomonas oryzae]|uniref:NAD(P)/FAD-dependent oxidoreductase n=1 Tax=Falsiroseomonas oryzae TaxID=2766473 RepID=UPI0022EB4D53|nr:FAD-dependent monooxygenase [Roseomonas sp. MO-31]
MSRVVVVGGGPAGAATAIALARAGRPPLLLERDAAVSEKVCGEFLGADAARLLAGLGIELEALGAVPIRHAVLAAGRWQAEAALPFAAWGLPRATLDAALLCRAREAGAEVRLGAAVASAQEAGAGWQLRLGSGEVVEASRLVLATGKHDLRGLSRGSAGGALGLKLPLHGSLPATVALLSCRGGYAGLQPRPGGGANLCAALDPRTPGVAAAARSAEALMAHVARGSALAESLLAGLRSALGRPLAVAGVPYGFRHRGGGPFRVGDQAAVIPSFCGDGVAMALASGLAAAAAIDAGDPAARHHACWSAAVAGGMRLAGLCAMLHRRAPRLLVGAVSIAPVLLTTAALQTRLGAMPSRHRCRALVADSTTSGRS